MKKLSAFFYIVIGILTAGLLVTLSLWIIYKTPLLLYITFGEASAYILIVSLNTFRNTIEFQTNVILKSEFLMLVQNVETKIVYITYTGNEHRGRKPSRIKRDYLVEFYPEEADLEALKKHLWFDPSPKDEAMLKSLLIGGMDVPFPLLGDISRKKLVLQERFYEEVSSSPLFESLLSNNEVVLYGGKS